MEKGHCRRPILNMKQRRRSALQWSWALRLCPGILSSVDLMSMKEVEQMKLFAASLGALLLLLEYQQSNPSPRVIGLSEAQ